MLHIQIRGSFFTGMLCLFLSEGLIAQQDTVPMNHHLLKEVEVVEKARPAVNREGVPLQVMNQSDMLRLGVQELSEAVRRFSGVTIKDYGGIGGLKTVSVRSLGAQHTAVSYDGVAISDVQSGQVDIGRFSLDNVEQISLSIGQNDDIFQTARMYASAGALQIKTTHPEFDKRSFRFKALMKAGSFGFLNPALRYEQRLNDRFAITAHADWMRADGNYPFTLTNGKLVTEEKRKNSDINSIRTEANLFGNFRNNGTFSAKVYYFDSERGLPGSVILYNDYTHQRLWDKNFFTQLYYENKLSQRFLFHAQAKYNYTWNKYLDVDNKYENGKQEDRHIQNEYYGSISGLYSFAKYLSVSLATDFFINTLRNNLPECPFPTRYSSLSVLAGQYKSNNLTLTASLLGTYMTERVKQGDRPSDRKRLSPSLSSSWRIFEDQNIRLRASYKDIFRVPTFNDLYYLRMGNTSLRPECATLYNVGATWSGEVLPFSHYLSLSVDGYYNRVKDKIVALPTMYIWKMMNMGEVSIHGIDATLATEIPIKDKMMLLVNGTYSFQKAIDITNKTAKNYRNQIPYTPLHSGTFSLAFENPWINIAYNLTAVGNRYALPQNIDDNLIKSYIEQGISLNREFAFRSCKLRLQGEVINLANINYDVIKFYPMPGRSFRINITYIL